MKWMSALWLLALTATISAQERLNPFANPEAALAAGGDTVASNASGLELRAVMPSDSYPLANINGEILSVGEEFFGYLLVAVTDRNVTLQRGSGSVVLELSPGLEEADD